MNRFHQPGDLITAPIGVLAAQRTGVTISRPLFDFPAQLFFESRAAPVAIAFVSIRVTNVVEVQAIDINTGKQVWSDKTALPWNDGMLSTASGLVFSGSADGYFKAFDAKTGKVVWTSPKMSSGIIGVPVSYQVDGKQYIAVLSGWGGATPIWGGMMAKDKAVSSIPTGGELHVFALQ